MPVEPSTIRDDSEWALSGAMVPLLGILCLAAAALVVDPIGNFPLNDDWDFATTTWRLIDTGSFIPSPFLSSSLRLQALWGALWTVLFGRSFTVLRFSTLSLAALTLLLLNRFLERNQVRPALRLFAVLSLLFHPLFFWSSFTFMTQVPFLFMSLLALDLFHRGISRDDLRFVWAGAVAVIGASFVRQMGIATMFAPLAALLVLREQISPRWKRLLVPLAVAATVFLVLMFGTRSLISSEKAFAFHRKVVEPTFTSMVYNLIITPLMRIFFNFQSGALFALPVVGALLAGGFRLNRRGLTVMGAALLPSSLILWRLISIGALMPYRTGGNVFSNLASRKKYFEEIFCPFFLQKKS